MRTSKLALLVNVAAIAALYLSACGGETNDPTPVVTPPPVHTGSGMGTLRVSAPSALTVAIILVDGAMIAPGMTGLPHDLDLTAGPHMIKLMCDRDWECPETQVMVAEDTINIVTVAARPDPTPAVGQFDWWKDGQIYKTETWSAQMDEPNKILQEGLVPCDTGVLIVRPSKTMCMPSPDKLYFRYYNDESDCTLGTTPQVQTKYDCVNRTIGFSTVTYVTWIKR